MKIHELFPYLCVKDAGQDCSREAERVQWAPQERLR